MGNTSLRKYYRKRTGSSRAGPKPLIGHLCLNSDNLKDDLDSRFYINLYMGVCRGLQLRNWIRTEVQLRRMKASDKVVAVIFNSWARFKFAQTIRPKFKQFFVYMLKNYSSLEGQNIYSDTLDHFSEDPASLSYLYYHLMGITDSRYFRALEYFGLEDPEWILPLELFPRIDFEKSKMDLCDVPYEFTEQLKKEVHEKVFNYVLSLDIKSIFIPKPETMVKYGNQRFNDEGVVRFDYERPSNSFDSSFLYQRFLTKPLTPREVWLPGKAIKQNNSFFMLVHRQILDKDPIYPSTDIEEMRDYMSRIASTMALGFDISGYGFQYLREILIAANNAIRELYPCSALEEQSEIMETIFSKVSVTMPDGTVRYPKRGIGLGYYEDLKTIAMIALLREHNPLSVYGDQGILPLESLGFVETLLRYQFIMNPEKTVAVGSHGQLQWGGVSFSTDSMFDTKKMSSMIFGAFFSRVHWERKLALYSISKEMPKKYQSVQKRLADAYVRFFGHEFQKDDIYNSFERGGIMIRPYEAGYHRLWWVRGKLSPRSNLLFDPIYQTPFRLVSKARLSLHDAKAFSKKRKALFKKHPVMDSSIYDYSHPRLRYNKKKVQLPRVLPRWADLNLLLYHGLSSGTLTCGLHGEEIVYAAERQTLSNDPFRARATGGYSILTPWRTSRPPSQEVIELAEILRDYPTVSSLRVNRSDLAQNLMLHDDPMYEDTNLFSYLVERSTKRKASQISDITLPDAKKITSDVQKMLPSLIKSGKINCLADIVTSVERRLGFKDYGDNVSESSYGSLAGDDDYFADDIDMVDS